MKKSMTVITSSPCVFDNLHGKKCRGLHEHQPLEGNTRNGAEVLSRTKYSERYPRKFARIMAKAMLKRSIHHEVPFRWIPPVDPTLPCLGQSNRPRLPPIPELVPFAEESPPKRIRVEGKQAVN